MKLIICTFLLAFTSAAWAGEKDEGSIGFGGAGDFQEIRKGFEGYRFNEFRGKSEAVIGGYDERKEKERFGELRSGEIGIEKGVSFAGEGYKKEESLENEGGFGIGRKEFGKGEEEIIGGYGPGKIGFGKLDGGEIRSGKVEEFNFGKDFQGGEHGFGAFGNQGHVEENIEKGFHGGFTRDFGKHERVYEEIEGGHGVLGGGYGGFRGREGFGGLEEKDPKLIVKQEVKKVKYPFPLYNEKPVTIEKPVPYRVYESHEILKPAIKEKPVVLEHYKTVPYVVNRNIVKYVEKPVPFPVYLPKKVPYTVEKKVPYEVKVPYAVPVMVKQPYAVPVVKKVRYPVEKRVPYKVRVKEQVPMPYPKIVPIYKPVKYERTIIKKVPTKEIFEEKKKY